MWYLARTHRQPLTDAVLHSSNVFHHPVKICDVMGTVLCLANDRTLTLSDRGALGVESWIPAFGNFNSYLRICIFLLLTSMALHV